MRVLPRLCIEKIFFSYITMTFGHDITFAFVISVFSFAAYAFVEAVKRVFEYEEDIEELHWRLECCEQENSETEKHELKK